MVLPNGIGQNTTLVDLNPMFILIDQGINDSNLPEEVDQVLLP